MKASFTSDLTLFIRGRNSARGKNNDLVYVNYRQLGGDSFHSSGYYYNFFSLLLESRFIGSSCSRVDNFTAFIFLLLMRRLKLAIREGRFEVFIEVSLKLHRAIMMKSNKRRTRLSPMLNGERSLSIYSADNILINAFQPAVWVVSR